MTKEVETDRFEGIDRSPRAKQNRAETAQRRPWAPPTMLDAPPAPDGYKHRWIRAEVRGFDDRQTFQHVFVKAMNLFEKMNIPSLKLQLWSQVVMKVCLALVD